MTCFTEVVAYEVVGLCLRDAYAPAHHGEQ
jgi:hypothetical protein